MELIGYIMLGLVSFSYCVVMFVMCPALGSSTGYMALMTVLYALSLDSYYHAAGTDPGSPTPVTVPGVGGAGGGSNGDGGGGGKARKSGAKDGVSGEPARDGDVVFVDWEGSYDDVDDDGVGECGRCALPKPARAHHCSRCNTCILRMDHHCPWLGICVGFYNYKAFVLTCIYFAVTSSLNMVTLWPFLTVHIESLTAYNNRAPWEMAAVMAHTLLNIFTFGFGWLLAGSHSHLTATNQTTIEAKSRIGGRSGLSRRLARRYPNVKPPKFHRYDYGTLGNIKSVLGPSVLWWWTPRVPTTGNGMRWRISELYRAEAEERARAAGVQVV